MLSFKSGNNANQIKTIIRLTDKNQDNRHDNMVVGLSEFS